MKKRAAGVKGLHIWQKRYFTLNARNICYYDSEKKDHVHNVISLADILEVKWHSGKKNGTYPAINPQSRLSLPFDRSYDLINHEIGCRFDLKIALDSVYSAQDTAEPIQQSEKVFSLSFSKFFSS